ncbi:MAG: alpha/beta fold hydrolase, partial [Crocinitomicaceae bacterium]|nr:alpha/beta fold hydrolase [Crocinitomicaceae bacterium]
MKNTSILILFLSSFLSFGQITGTWHTAFVVAGTTNRMDLFIEGIGRDAALKIGLPDVPDFEPKLMENAEILKESLTFKWETLGLKFEGNYYQKGDSIYGTMTQSTIEWQVTFKREEQTLKKLVRPQEPKSPFPYKIEELLIKNGDNTIGATLTIPENTKNFPIVILASGSGAQNRDCELMGHKPFWVIADYLSRNGIAVLRFDDRGTGKSTGVYHLASLEDFASDVEACYKYARKRYKKHKIGLTGHSEGGMHTLIAASKDKKIDFVIQLAAVGTNGRKVLVEQQYLIPLKNGETEEVASFNRIIYDTVTKILMEVPKSDFQKNLKAYVDSNFEKFPAKLKEESSKEEIVTGFIAFFDNNWARQFMSF